VAVGVLRVAVEPDEVPAAAARGRTRAAAASRPLSVTATVTPGPVLSRHAGATRIPAGGPAEPRPARRA
jgi:hypothetical protein